MSALVTSAILALCVLVSPWLLFHNLERNPRPWHDEAEALSIPRTLVEDGVYAVKGSDGYRRFGAVQSVGPTVVLPVALSFRVLGVGLWQGRLVGASYALITLWLFFLVAAALMGRLPALLAVVLMLGSPAAGFLLNGRQVLGEVPALGFFLAGWLMWRLAVRSGRRVPYIVAGLLFGAAIVTKSQYLPMVLATGVVLAGLDRFYYRRGETVWLLLMVAVAAGCGGAWLLTQYWMFGPEVFAENARNLRALAAVTTGFNRASTISAVRFLFGAGSGYLDFFWGWPAVAYALLLAAQRDEEGLTTAFLAIFTCLWIGYFTFLTIPWWRYFLPAGVLVALFVGKLFADIGRSVVADRAAWSGVVVPNARRLDDAPRLVAACAMVAALLAGTLGAVYQLQKVVRDDVRDRVGAEESLVTSPRQFDAPAEMARFLQARVGPREVVETWERELGILTALQFHHPEQMMLVDVHRRLYRGGTSAEYGLGEAYFSTVRPDWLVIGWYSRTNGIYDMGVVDRLFQPVTTIGSGNWRYDVFRRIAP